MVDGKKKGDMRDEPSVNTVLLSRSVVETRLAQSCGSQSEISKIKRSRTSPDAGERGLSPISTNAMNVLNGKSTISAEHTKLSRSSTIRSVPAEPLSLSNTRDSSSRRSQTPSDSSQEMIHSTHNAPTVPSIPSVSSINTITLNRQSSNSTGLSVTKSVVRRISSEFGPARSHSTSNVLHTPNEPSSSSSGAIDTNETGSISITNSIGQATSPLNGNNSQWSTAVGRSTLGKSGRVIEKLQNQLDTMRRELSSEKANTAEYKNAISLAEARMAQMKEEYEMELHDAALAKTSLKRRDRQNADLKEQIEAERKRVDKAVEREIVWKAQMEQIEADSKRKVEEAQTHAALMDGRVKAMTSHWQDQKAEVNRTVTKLRDEIRKIQEARRADDEKIRTLKSISDQQADKLLAVIAEKEDIFRQFEEYKREQEKSLLDIKSTAKSRLEETEETLGKSQEVLGNLKWALNLHGNARDSSH